LEELRRLLERLQRALKEFPQPLKDREKEAGDAREIA
jgi:hypothetical protein